MSFVGTPKCVTFQPWIKGSNFYLFWLTISKLVALCKLKCFGKFSSESSHPTARHHGSMDVLIPQNQAVAGLGLTLGGSELGGWHYSTALRSVVRSHKQLDT